MTNQLFIKEQDTWEDAYTLYGITLLGGSIAALLAPAPMKAYITNASRAEHGTRIITALPRLDSREVTLTFSVEGDTPLDFQLKYRRLVQKLQSGEIVLKFAADDLPDVFHLVYTKSSTYALNQERTFCKMAVKLTEPNPANRQA